MLLPSGICNWLNNDCFKLDKLYGSYVVGRGIGNYILDLRALGGSDAAVDASKNLNALPVMSYYLGYTHYWTPKLYSSMTFSQVDLNSIASQGPSAYRHGRYAAVGLMYEQQVHLIADLTKDAGPHYAIVGLEYIYGEKMTIANGSGSDNRVQFTLGLKF